MYKKQICYNYFKNRLILCVKRYQVKCVIFHAIAFLHYNLGIIHFNKHGLIKFLNILLIIQLKYCFNY
jgi:hypothetical protein